MLFKACCLLPNVRCKLYAVCSMQHAACSMILYIYIYTVQCTGWVKKQGWIARAYNYSSNLFKISRCERNNIYTVQCTGWVKKQGWIARAYNYSSNLFKISRCDRNNYILEFFLLIKFLVKNIFAIFFKGFIRLPIKKI